MRSQPGLSWGIQLPNPRVLWLLITCGSYLNEDGHGNFYLKGKQVLWGETDHSGRRKYQKTKFSLTFLKRQKWKNKD